MGKYDLWNVDIDGRILDYVSSYRGYNALSVNTTTVVWCDEGRSESKERFAIQRVIDNRKETEYAGFVTPHHLLLHIVTLDTEALVVP